MTCTELSLVCTLCSSFLQSANPVQKNKRLVPRFEPSYTWRIRPQDHGVLNGALDYYYYSCKSKMLLNCINCSTLICLFRKFSTLLSFSLTAAYQILTLFLFPGAINFHVSCIFLYTFKAVMLLTLLLWIDVRIHRQSPIFSLLTRNTS